MWNADNFEPEFGPYCQCCGSREVMTLDVSIAESDDWERRSYLIKKRLWLAIDGLDEGEVSEFILDAIPHVNVEEDHEVEFGLHSYLMEGSAHSPDRYHSYDQTVALDLEEICEGHVDDFLQDRKDAFIRLWKGFDAKTQSSFLRLVGAEFAKSGGE